MDVDTVNIVTSNDSNSQSPLVEATLADIFLRETRNSADSDFRDAGVNFKVSTFQLHCLLLRTN
jgi:hypothetical protein